MIRVAVLNAILLHMKIKTAFWLRRELRRG
jgi:hypothetical protein